MRREWLCPSAHWVTREYRLITSPLHNDERDNERTGRTNGTDRIDELTNSAKVADSSVPFAGLLKPSILSAPRAHSSRSTTMGNRKSVAYWTQKLV